jgi:hypothetical protein
MNDTIVAIIVIIAFQWFGCFLAVSMSAEMFKSKTHFLKCLIPFGWVFWIIKKFIVNIRDL